MAKAIGLGSTMSNATMKFDHYRILGPGTDQASSSRVGKKRMNFPQICGKKWVTWAC